MNIAFKIKELNGWKGNAILYQLVPPIKYEDSDGVFYIHNYVVVSAIILDYRQYNISIPPEEETYIFPANNEGVIFNNNPLPGSMKNTLSHKEVLNYAGYTISKFEAKKLKPTYENALQLAKKRTGD